MKIEMGIELIKKDIENKNNKKNQLAQEKMKLLDLIKEVKK